VFSIGTITLNDLERRNDRQPALSLRRPEHVSGAEQKSRSTLQHNPVISAPRSVSAPSFFCNARSRSAPLRSAPRNARYAMSNVQNRDRVARERTKTYTNLTQELDTGIIVICQVKTVDYDVDKYTRNCCRSSDFCIAGKKSNLVVGV